MTPTSTDDRVLRVVAFFESLTPAALEHIEQIYDAQAYFKDPFHEVRGTPAIAQIFHHMYATLHEPRFVVWQTVCENAHCFIVWDFHFRFKGLGSQRKQSIRGCSQLRFTPEGKIAFHHDYWDAAQQLYEKLPVIGIFMRWLRRRAQGSA